MRSKSFLKYKLNIICSLCSLAIILLAWVIAYYSVQNDYIVPSLGDTFVALFNCFGQSSFWVAVGNTLLRVIVAFAISFVLAAVCALLSAVSGVFAKLINPLLIILRTLPTLAVVLIILLWTTPKIAPAIITLLVLFPMIYSQFLAAIGDVDRGIIEMADVYGISKGKRLTKIYLPQISANAFSQIGANLSLGLKVMVSAEVMANTAKSLGGAMSYARSFLEVSRLAALTLFAILLGFIFELAFGCLKHVNDKWRAGNGN